MEKKKIIALLVCIVVGGILVSGIILADWMSPSEEASKEAPKQELVVGYDQDIGSIKPGSVAGLWTLTFLVYDGLTEIDQDYNKKPGLAESWEMSQDGRVWTFHLRKGVRFHDGTKFDSEDVKFTFETFLEKPFGSLRFLEKIECPDSYTVNFILKKPSYLLASDLAMQNTAIISSTSPVDEKSGKVIEAIGTGPFKVEKWVKGQEIVLVRNDEYWKDAPKLERLIFKVIPDPETRIMALESGQIDLLYCKGLITAIPRLLKNPKIKIDRKLGQNTVVIFLKTQKEPFDDLQVRKAINYAIDVNTSVKSLLGDVAVPAEHIFSPAFKHFNNPEVKPYGHDPEKARHLLSKAGWRDTDGDGVLEKNEKEFRVTLTFDARDPGYQIMAQAVQNQLKKVGINVRLQPVDYAALRKSLTSGEFDMLMVREWYIPHDDPSNHYYAYYHSSGILKIYSNDKLDQLIDQLEVTIDQTERLRLHYGIQKEIMDNAPAIFLYHPYNIVAAERSVKDVKASVGFWQDYESLEKAWIE